MTSLYAIAVAGAVVGAIDAIANDHRALWPSMIDAGAQHVLRPGILATMLTGGAAGAAVLLASEGRCAQDGALGNVFAWTVSLAVAALAARCTTSASDKRLLHAAFIKACGAPAAHPDTLRHVESGSARAAYAVAEQLVPHVRAWP